jgi:hypothetical protein
MSKDFYDYFSENMEAMGGDGARMLAGGPQPNSFKRLN